MEASEIRAQTYPREVRLSAFPEGEEKDTREIKNFCRYVMIHVIKRLFGGKPNLKHYSRESANLLFFGIPVPPGNKLTEEEKERIKNFRNDERGKFICRDIFPKLLQACCSLRNKVAANMFDKLNTKFQEQKLQHSEIISATINKLSLTKEGVVIDLFLQIDSDIQMVCNPILIKITNTPLPEYRRKESRKKKIPTAAANNQTEENKDDEGPFQNQKKSGYYEEYSGLSFLFPLSRTYSQETNPSNLMRSVGSKKLLENEGDGLKYLYGQPSQFETISSFLSDPALILSHEVSPTISQENNLSNLERREIDFEELFENEGDEPKYPYGQSPQYQALSLRQRHSGLSLPDPLCPTYSQENNLPNRKTRMYFEELLENEGNGPKYPYELSFENGILSPLQVPSPSLSTGLLQKMEHHNHELNELQPQDELFPLHPQENNLWNTMRREIGSEKLLQNDGNGLKYSYRQPSQYKGLSSLQSYPALTFPHELSHINSQERDLSNTMRRGIGSEKLLENEGEGLKYAYGQSFQNGILSSLQVPSPSLSKSLLQKMGHHNHEPNKLQPQDELFPLHSQENNLWNTMRRGIGSEKLLQNDGNGLKYSYRQPSQYKSLSSLQSYPVLSLPHPLCHIYCQERDLLNMMRRIDSEGLLENEGDGPKYVYEQSFQNGIHTCLQVPSPSLSTGLLQKMEHRNREPNELQRQVVYELPPPQRQENLSNMRERMPAEQPIEENKGDRSKEPAYGQPLQGNGLSQECIEHNNRKPNEPQHQAVNELPPSRPQENLSNLRERMPAEQPIEENKGDGSKDPSYAQPSQGNRLSQEHIEHNNRQPNELQRQAVNELLPSHLQENPLNILKRMGSFPLKGALDAIACLLTGRKTRWESVRAPERIEGELYEILIYRNKDCYPLIGPKYKKTTVEILVSDLRRKDEIRVIEFEAKSRSWTENARSMYPKVNAWVRLVFGVELQKEAFFAKTIDH